MTAHRRLRHGLLKAAALAVALPAGAVPHPSAAAQATPPPTTTATVFGSTRSTEDGRTAALPHTLVVATIPDGRRWTVQADEFGQYRIAGIAPGPISVTARHVGHVERSLEVTVPAGSELQVDFELTVRPIRLDPLSVRVSRLPAAKDDESPDNPYEGGPSPSALSVLGIESLGLGPGVGGVGLAAAVGSLPGNDPANPSDVLYLRGSSADMKLVLLDGAPVYAPFHLAGLMKGFEPLHLAGAVLHVGGAPARHDGGLSHILEVATRSPRRGQFRGSAALDMMSASATLETGLGETAGIMVSGRSLHGLGSSALGEGRPYGYGEALAVGEFEFGSGHLVKATGFLNDETVRLGHAGGPESADWSNGAGVVSYRGDIAGASVKALLATSRYDAGLPLTPADTTSTAPLTASAAADRSRAFIEAEWGTGSQRTAVGISYGSLSVAYRASPSKPPSGPAPTTPGTEASGTRSSVGFHIDHGRRIAPGVTLRAGARADAYSGGIFRVAPRARLAWALDATSLLEVAVGRYHQATRTPEVEVERTLTEVVDAGPAGPPSLLPVASADHVVLSLDQMLAAGRLRLGLQGYWKNYRGLGVTKGDNVRGSGFDLRLGSSASQGLIWLGYGLSWYWSAEDLSGYANDFAGRHLLSAGFAAFLPNRLRLEGRIAYGAGLPYTAIPFGSATEQAEVPAVPGGGVQTDLDSPLVAGLDDDFLRLDLEVHTRLMASLAGRTLDLRPYLRVVNALRQRDALFYAFEPWRPDSLRALAERPFLPVFGIAVTF